MITWTPEAERAVYGYLNEVARLAAIRGEDGEELQSNLLEHIRSEVAERDLDLVTEEQARQIINQLGAPEDIVGEGGESVNTQKVAPPPVPPQSPSATPQPPQRQGMRWTSPAGCLIATIIGLIFLFVVVPVAAIVLAIAVPNLTRARVQAELAEQKAQVLATLHYIVEAEEEFRKAAVIDRNGDGISDYGTLEELNAWIEGKQIPYEAYGYKFTIDVRYGDEDTEPQYHCRAEPIDTRWPGPGTNYYVNQNRVIRYSVGAEVPSEHSDPLETIPGDSNDEPETKRKTQYLP